jgi:hypothetical protein
MVDVAEGLDMEGEAILIGQLHADAVIVAFLDCEMVIGLEVIAL